MTIVRTSLRNFVAHKGRMVLSALAVLLSVAFVCGTLVFTDTMNTTFSRLFDETAADVTVSARNATSDAGYSTGKPETIPAQLADRLAAVDGVKDAVPAVASSAVTVVDENNERVGSTAGAPTIAANYSPQESRMFEVRSGHAPRRAGEAMIDIDTAEKYGLELGDELRAITAVGDFRARITGIGAFTTTNPGATMFYLDMETAQRQLLGSTDLLTNVYLEAEEGVTHTALKRRVVAALGDDAAAYKVQTAAEYSEESQRDIAGALDVLKYALLGFAGIALLVGVFLIVNTFSMLVAQRTREIGLMRAVGAERGQVNRSVLIEAVLLGVVGSVLGVGAGIGLAIGLMELMGQLGLNLATNDLTIRWSTPVVGLVLGVAVTVLAAYLPARRAGRISPMAALRDETTASDVRVGRVRNVIGVLFTLGGGAALLAATQASSATAGVGPLALGVVLTLVGFVLIGPLLSGLVVRVLGAVVLRVFGPVGRMAERNALRNPRRTGATAAALMIGLALVASLSVVGASLIASAGRQLDRTIGADFVVQSDNGQPVTDQAVAAARRAEGVDHVTEHRLLRDARIAPGDGPAQQGRLSAVSPTYAEDMLVETAEGRFSDALARDHISVDETYAEKHGLSVGDTLEVSFTAEDDPTTLTIGAITSSASESAVGPDAKFVSVETVRAHLADASDLPLNAVLFVQAVDGQQKAAYQALKAELEPYPQFAVRDQAEYKELLEEQVGQLLYMIYGLLALAIIVAVLGVVNTLALSVVERTREIGLLRAIGLSRRQLRRMIRLESVVIALFGALLGLGLGLAWGVAGQQLLALRGLDVLDIPWSTMITVFFGSALVGLVAALVPAFRAGRMNVLNAIATE